MMSADFPEIEFSIPGKVVSSLRHGVVSEDEWGRYALIKAVLPDDLSSSPYEQASSAFTALERELFEADMSFSDVVRTWIYADRILEWYADFNRARDGFFKSRGVYGRYVPASTGIGWTNDAGARLVLGAFAWLSGNIIYTGYLNFMYIPGSGELLVYAAAMAGALLGFMWYNCFPAQVFMGDTGSLAIGGVIAVFALLIRKELLLPILCGIFLVESLSVIIQRSYFKYTKKRYGEGRRVFLMSPLHHHYQKRGFHESKIVVRAIIIGVLLAAITLSTLKVR